MPVKLQSTDLENISDLYKSGKTLQTIADEYSVSRETIAKTLRKLGVEIWDKRVVHPRDYEKVLSLYSEGRTMKGIAKFLGVSRESVAKTVKKFGIIPENGNSRLASFGVDKQYFENNTQGAAYFFGLLLADGNILDSGTVSIALQRDDHEILDELKSSINTPSSVRYHTRKAGESYCQLSFTVKELSDSLTELGMVPRKSLEEKAPLRFVKNRHFWRGMVDGDGSVGYHPGKSARLYLCGSKEMCQQFLVYCQSIVPEIDSKVVISKGSLYRISFYGIKAAKLLKELYSDSEYKLQRKFNKALNVFQQYGIKYD